jgi:hypothetical protein
LKDQSRDDADHFGREYHEARVLQSHVFFGQAVTLANFEDRCLGQVICFGAKLNLAFVLFPMALP